jgi:hypothetical protein
MTTTVKVYCDDCQGNLADGEMISPDEWSVRATARHARLADASPDSAYGVVRVDGREHVVKAVVEATRIYWKAV